MYELQSLMKKSLSSQELSLAETRVKEPAVLRHRMVKFSEPIDGNCFSPKWRSQMAGAFPTNF